MRAVQAIDKARYRKLVAAVLPAVIESEEDNDHMLAEAERLMTKGDDLSPEEKKLLKLIVKLIEDFEEEHYKIPASSPLDVLKHLMEARGIKQSDLWDLFGSKGIASETLNGKRSISKSQAKALAEYFHVSASLFI